jgi:hypothetical protein
MTSAWSATVGEKKPPQAAPAGAWPSSNGRSSQKPAQPRTVPASAAPPASPVPTSRVWFGLSPISRRLASRRSRIEAESRATVATSTMQGRVIAATMARTSCGISVW